MTSRYFDDPPLADADNLASLIAEIGLPQFMLDYDVDGLRAGEHWNVDPATACEIIDAAMARISNVITTISDECAASIRALPPRSTQ